MASEGMSKPHDLITEADVKATLKADKGNNSQLTSWTIEDFTQKGDNYATFVTGVKVIFTQEGLQQNASYVVKLNPKRPVFKDFDKFGRTVFQKEAGFYREISSVLSVELEAAGLDPLRVPRCFHTVLTPDCEAIYLEDLRQRGFQMFDRRKGMDTSHTDLVVKELARLHAASLLLQAKNDSSLADDYDFLKLDWTNYSDDAKTTFNWMIKAHFETAIEMLQHVGGYEAAVKYLEHIKEDPSGLFDRQMERKKPFDMICHGDCWNNNILFRYNDDGSPVEVMLLDLQLCRMASPATDLNYVLYTSLNGNVRKDNLQDFLASYHDTFSSVLKLCRSPIPFTLQDLKGEFTSKLEYGLLFGVMLVSIVLMEADDVPEIDKEFREEDVEKLMNEWKDKMFQMLDTRPTFKPRFLSIFDDMIEAGVIV